MQYPPTYTPRHWKLRQKNMRIHTLRSSSSCCFKDFSRRLTFQDSAQCSRHTTVCNKDCTPSACQLPCIDKAHLQGEKIGTKSMYLSISMLTKDTSIASLFVESESLNSLNSKRNILGLFKETTSNHGESVIGLTLCICKLGPRPSCRCVTVPTVATNYPGFPPKLTRHIS